MSGITFVSCDTAITISNANASSLSFDTLSFRYVPTCLVSDNTPLSLSFSNSYFAGNVIVGDWYEGFFDERSSVAVDNCTFDDSQADKYYAGLDVTKVEGGSERKRSGMREEKEREREREKGVRMGERVEFSFLVKCVRI